MKNWLKNRPWIWIVLFFLAFMSAWAWFIVIALRNVPEVVPLEPTHAHHAES